MSKGLEALEEIKTCRLIKRMKYKEGLFSNKLIDYEMTYGKDAFYRQIPIIEKELKVLEIIKEKKVDVGVLTHVITISLNPLKDYNETIWEDEKENRLTKEEWDLLKEVLK